jgi:hypothetical protein
MRHIAFITILILLALPSCKKSNSDSNNLVRWNINRVEGPATGMANQSINLLVYYPTSSGCDVLEKFEQTTQDKIMSIKAYGYTQTSGNCTAGAIEQSITLSFTISTPGSYELRFIQKDNSYITFNLTIN